METISASNVVKAQQQKLIEIQAQQEKLKILQVELGRLNEKIEKNEKLTPDESAYLGQLGWLSAAAVTIASIAASL
jgi:predicted nuclease with TOPRIM domain